MKLVSKTDETKTVELTTLELHLITKALDDYRLRAFELTNNHNHSDAVDKAWMDMVDVYCED